MDAIDVLRARRCIRVFRTQPVPREMIEIIVDCGRLAPSAINIQPWEFVVVTEAARRLRIAQATDFGAFISEAPVCIAVFCHPGHYFLEDGAAATENLMLAATALGLGACWVAGDKKPYAAEIGRILGVPGDLRLVSLVPIGYPAESPMPAKRPLSEVIHWERY